MAFNIVIDGRLQLWLTKSGSDRFSSFASNKPCKAGNASRSSTICVRPKTMMLKCRGIAALTNMPGPMWSGVNGIYRFLGNVKSTAAFVARWAIEPCAA